ncbi:MAG: efflux RND transporter periplasmic adaptor subunit [Verrucomicrobiales bacterium]|nr:efflux RND transporter periplasmic adaptor subunit [Verrucomicrobiales bacterium]
MSDQSKAPPAGNTRRRKNGPSAGCWFVLALVLLAALWFGLQALRNAQPAGAEGGGAPPGGNQGPPPATVIVSTVVQKPVQERRRITGSLRAVQRAEVATQESGAVKRVLVDVGDTVKAGDLLVELDERRLKASLAEANARLVAASSFVEEREVEEKRALVDLERMEKLFRGKAVSEREFLDSQREAAVSTTQKNSAEQERDATKSARDLLQVSVDDLAVTAPFDGQVVERHVDPGEWLSTGNSVVTLVSTGTIEAWVSVPERFVTEISASASALEIVVDGNDLRVPARSIKRVADIDPVTRLFPVVVEVDNSNGLLAPGLSVHTELPVGEEEELPAVPVDAVIETFEGASVFRVSKAEGGGLPIAEKVSVAVRFRENGLVYLEPGSLRPGEKVVVEGNERLFPGTPLMASESPEEATRERVEELKP